MDEHIMKKSSPLPASRRSSTRVPSSLGRSTASMLCAVFSNTVPVPSAWLKPGAWAVFAMVLAFAWYWKHSHRLGGALLVAFVVLALITAWLFDLLGPVRLRWAALAVFVLAWIGQFVGHKFEGHRPSFLTDLSYLLVGPAWLMEKFLRRLGFKAHD